MINMPEVRGRRDWGEAGAEAPRVWVGHLVEALLCPDGRCGLGARVDDARQNRDGKAGGGVGCSTRPVGGVAVEGLEWLVPSHRENQATPGLRGSGGGEGEGEGSGCGGALDALDALRVAWSTGWW